MDLTIAVTASALMTVGFTADVGPGLQIGAEARYQEWFSLGLEVRGVLPQRVFARDKVDPTIGYSMEQQLDVSQVTAQLVPCLRFTTWLGVCGVAQGGLLVAHSPEIESLLPSLAFGPRVHFELPLGERFALFAFGEALFTEGHFIDFRDPGPDGEPAPNVMWRQSTVSGFFGGGMLLKFE